MKTELAAVLEQAIAAARAGGDLAIDEAPQPHLEIPRDKEHGDLATNVAMLLSKAARRPPREIAELLTGHISDPSGMLSRVEVAGPGFINFTFSDGAWRDRLVTILQSGDDYGSSKLGEGKRVQVEFVSANPTGPLHIGHGRGAASGDALARILEAVGFEVDREYYINDAGVQIETLGRSVHARYLELCGQDVEFPEDGYPGQYVTDIASDLKDEEGPRWVEAPAAEAVSHFGAVASARMLEEIRSDLDRFGVRMDNYQSELELRSSGDVERAIEALRAAGHVYDKDGAVWFNATEFGDDKDRPLIKSDGQLTYFAADVGYHFHKLEQGYDTTIDVWGADHHGYVKRVKAALEALGKDPSKLTVLLVQMVNLTRDGEPVRMGKRSGEFVGLREVIDEVGPDLARFFFLMRKSDAQLEFDLELARRQSAENPVFYVQYAHTRIAGIFRQADQKGLSEPSADSATAQALEHPDEIALVRVLDEFPDVVESAALSYEPHRVVFYAQRLAGDFHRFYSKHKCVTDDARLTAARLLLVSAVKLVIGRALRLVGVNAPERM